MPVMDRIERSAKDANSFQDFISSDGRANGAEAGRLFLFRAVSMKT